MSNNKQAQRNPSGEHRAANITKDQATFIAGPLPNSLEFSGYEKAVPGAGSRILAMAESEAEHRRGEDQKGGTRNHVCMLIGQFLGFSLIAGCISAGVWLFANGKDPGGFALVGGGLFTAIVAYLRAYAPRSQ